MADEIATRAQILVWLSEAAKRGNVPAMRLLLEELRQDETGAEGGVIDDLARRRERAPRLG